MISLAPLLVLAASVQITETPQASTALFAPANEALLIPAYSAEEEWSYLNLVEDYLRITGQQFSYTDLTRSELGNAHSTFEFSLEVPPAEVQHIFECLLALEHFVIVPDRSEHAEKIHTLLYTSSREGPNEEQHLARAMALPISLAELASYEKHPAVLVETLVPTGSIEARLLSNAERAMTGGGGLQSIMPAGDSNALVVRGRGPTVLTQVRTWQRAMGETLVEDRGLTPKEITTQSEWPLPIPES